MIVCSGKKNKGRIGRNNDGIQDIERLTNEKCTSTNKRFHASGGVCPQEVLWKIGNFPPARTFVEPPLLSASGRQRRRTPTMKYEKKIIKILI